MIENIQPTTPKEKRWDLFQAAIDEINKLRIEVDTLKHYTFPQEPPAKRDCTWHAHPSSERLVLDGENGAWVISQLDDQQAREVVEDMGDEAPAEVRARLHTT